MKKEEAKVEIEESGPISKFKEMEAGEGFTLIEGLAVIAILLIITSVGVFGLSIVQPNLKLNGATRDLVSDLRYAQQLAVAEQIDYGVLFSTTTEDKYQIVKHEDGTTTIKEVNLEKDGIYLDQISSFTNNEVRFNPYGATSNSESGTITLRNNKNATATIEVGPAGFVKILD